MKTLDEIIHLGEVWTEIPDPESKPSIARITGPDPQYGLKREWVAKKWSNNRVGFIVSEPGIYHYKNLAIPQYFGGPLTLVNGYAQIEADGSVLSIPASEARQMKNNPASFWEQWN